MSTAVQATTGPEPERRTLVGAEGNRLAAEVWGAGDPVVLLHGGGQSRRSWRPTARRIAEVGRSAWAVDLRGHGDSDWSADGGYGLAQYAADLRAVVDTLDARPALVGASLGGAAAMVLLGTGPGGGAGLATGLVLIDVAPRLEVAGVSKIRDFMRASPDGFASLGEAAEAIAAYRPGRRPPSSDRLARILGQGDDGRYRWQWDPRIIDAADCDPAAGHDALAAVARRVRVPSLLAYGANSDVVSPEGVRELRRLMPRAEVVEVAGAGHMVAGDANDRFGDAIVDFVLRH